MPSAGSLLIDVLAPAVCAGFVLLLDARRASPDGAAPARFDAGAPVGAFAFGAGYLIAHGRIVGIPDLPGAGRTLPFLAWILWLVAGAVVLSPLLGLARRAPWARTVYVALFSVLLDRLLRTERPRELDAAIHAFAGILAVYALWKAIDRIAARRPGPAVPAALLAATSGTALACFANGSAALAQLVGAIAAMLGAATAVALFARDARLPSGAVAVAAIGIAGAVHVAVVYDLPLGARVLIAAAFAAPWLNELPGLRVRARLAGSVAAAVALAASLGAAAIAAAR